MKTIRDILEKITDLKPIVEDGNGHTNDRLTSVLQYAKQQELDQALKEIEQLLLDSLPEEIDAHEKKDIGFQERLARVGYNQALEDTRKAIKSIIGGKNV